MQSSEIWHLKVVNFRIVREIPDQTAYTTPFSACLECSLVEKIEFDYKALATCATLHHPAT